MAGYVSSWTAINGDLIDASLFNNEYSAVEAAFDPSTGHIHDGADGSYVSLISEVNGFTQVVVNPTNIEFSVNVASVKTLQLRVIDGALVPTTTNDIDLGGVAAEFKDIYSAGTANLTNLDATGTTSLADLTISATTTVTSILNDGTMIANSPTALVTQSSLVSYVGAEITNATLDGGSF